MPIKVIAGRVGYERTVKDDDYGINRKFSGEFSFTAEPGDNWLDETSDVGNQLVALVHHKLNIKAAGKATVSVGTAAQQPGVGSPSPPPTGSNPVQATPEQIAAAEKAKEAAAYAMNKEDGKGPTEAPKAPRGPGRPKKEASAPAADPLAEMTGAATAMGTAGSIPTKTSDHVSADPLADLGAEANADELDGLLGEAPAPVVTDADLSKAITKKAGELKDGPRIRELANKFGGGPLPKQLRDIPAGKRWAFIQELNALQPK